MNYVDFVVSHSMYGTTRAVHIFSHTEITNYVFIVCYSPIDLNTSSPRYEVISNTASSIRADTFKLHQLCCVTFPVL